MRCSTCGMEMDYMGNDGVNGPRGDGPAYVCFNSDCGLDEEVN